ncbi:MAG: hypothetical protein JWO13_3929, partial [Acidobacteriales bacterium]|nr:hypothetical protein [Terriglobales bacterium]
MPTDLARVRELVRGERGLAVVSTLRSDGSVHNAVVN